MAVCEMINGECRFCSNEQRFVPFTKLVEDPKTKRLILGATDIRKETIGLRCNNDGNKMVSELHYCPARWGLINRGGYEGKEYQLAEKYVNPVGSA